MKRSALLKHLRKHGCVFVIAPYIGFDTDAGILPAARAVNPPVSHFATSCTCPR
jgi:hypothetical protein